MRLKKLLAGLNVQIFSGEDIEITGLYHNSKSVKPGGLYFALKNNDYVGDAVTNGAVAVVTAEQCYGVSCAMTDDPRLVMALASKRFYKNVADKMKIIGVVGTNGKTTTAYMVKHILETAAGRRVGFIGTTGIFGAGGEFDGVTGLTTPDPIDLHRALYQMYKNKIRTVVMEVSAHAIHYKKVAGIKFAGAVWTNISQDHLDFFNCFDDYKNAKISFFRDTKIKFAVINADDEYGEEIYRALSPKTKAITYSIGSRSGIWPYEIRPACSAARISADNIILSGGGSDFTVNVLGPVHIPICGEFNVYNALSAAAVALRLGVKPDKIKSALNSMAQVPGRFNTYDVNGVTVIIDYAHTPDGLQKILTSARALLPDGGINKLICVFGCGGDRDRSKRPIMGRISAEAADFTVITSDNPRTEDPDAIIAEIERGINTADVAAVIDDMLEKTGGKYTKITDRTEAIKHAVSSAKPGDIVVIAGKGHEYCMDINGAKIPYSDAEVVDTIIHGGR
jgi:UDP-N-acetylmuramoyl-L-alanyl-D-glutamate--2,6-diaminopimelate ligase